MKTAEEILSIIIPNDDYWGDIFPKVIKAMDSYATEREAKYWEINI